MKRNRLMKRLAMLFATVCVVGSVNALPAQAGLKEVVRDTSTVLEEINESVWHNASSDVTAENGVIVFPNESTKDTKLTIKTKVKANEGISEMAFVEGTLQFTSLPQGEKFVIALGLATIESELGESGNVEIGFTNEGGLMVSVTAYPESGETAELMPAKRCGSLNQTNVKVSLGSDQTLSLSIAGTQVYSGKLPVNGEGRIGFLQTGSCGVRVSNINIKSYDYERPENCDIEEDFEDGEFNKNLLTSKLIYRSYYDDEPYVGIDEIDGNKVFRFAHAPLCYLGTQYKYSNFEMSFDVPYLQRSNEVNEEGKVVNKASTQIILALGGEASNYSDYGHETSAERLLFREMSAITTKNGTTTDVHSVFPFFDPAYDKGFSIKVHMVDNVLTISMKWIEETKWTEVLSYRLQTPNGTIQIWGQTDCNWAIDNLKIVNLDANPNLIEVDYASSVIEVPDDYDYQPVEKVYAKEEEPKKDISLYWLIPIVAGVCIIGLGSTCVALHLKKRKRKGGVSNEK